ncbi:MULTISPECIES: 5-oxoprolinase subunit PxpB [unclassified Arenibacter]|uniref:5-oxoprolinase subunit PxpB n=1 Tax=unclassified Arenibacter TaxID=2615047 RepID=UPI000E3526C3|nr:MULTISPECIES: 5-oxoprolinase subunit PxpB [unclassified Arenibacter]MCM4163036.1 allophanate hydrolase subunit 1 [Arenibacter sp. A80]RFT57072.1 5-oxoprolinase subunit PxpB [Arenibacter sp. P308M17]
MNSFNISVRQFGVHAILVEWPNEVEETILLEILQFIEYLRKNHLDEKEWEYVPAYNSLTLICKDTVLDFDYFKPKIKEWYTKKGKVEPVTRYLWRLPVCYDPKFGLDLEEISEKLGMSIDIVTDLHAQSMYTVYGIGFLPGFMYLGGVPEALEIPRKSTPRSKVPMGSVGLAGKQTGIYPQDSPGGWNIIGKCPVPMFDLKKEKPCFVKVGDKIQFYPISMAEYQLHKIESEVGIYKLEKKVLDA